MIELTWCDQFGNELPRYADGKQFIRLLGGPCGLLDVRLFASPATSIDTVSLVGERPEQLENIGNGIFSRSPRTRKRLRMEEDSLKAAGEITAVALSKGTEVGRTRLTVLPANFTEAEHQQMLLEIGLAAISSASWVEASVGAKAVSPKRQGSTVGITTDAAELVLNPALELIEEFERALPIIHRRPLLTVRREGCVVPLHRAARKSRGIRQLVQKPGRRNIFAEALSDNFDSTENRFLRWIIERQLLPLIHVEKLRSSKTPDYRDEMLDALVLHAGERNDRLKSLADRVKEANLNIPKDSVIVNNLECVERKLLCWLSENPLKDTISIPWLVSPTERLLGTPGYREVFHAFELAQIALGRTGTMGIAIVNAVIRREVGATWRCYETWCFTQIVRAFGELAGFRTPPGHKTFGEFIEIIDGEIRIPRATPLVLRRGKVHVKLQYEPRLPSSRNGSGIRLPPGEIRNLTPDILVTIQRGRSKPRHFILDAKYRDYGKQGAKTVFRDLWKTALLKYRDGISSANVPDPTEITGSYILHSDPTARSSRNDFWGGIPAEEWLPHDESFVLDSECRAVRGHACGLIRLRPDKDRDLQLGKLIDMWLQFHVRPDGFECSRCGTKLEEGKDVRIEHKKRIEDENHEINYIRKAQREGWQTSVLCVCPTCNYYWFQNHCKRAGHPIFKLGHRSYHEESLQPWPTRCMYICPTCGDDPPPETFHEPTRYPNVTDLSPSRKWPLDPDDDIPF